MYRVVLVKGELRIPLPKSAGPQGELFDTLEGAVTFGTELDSKFPDQLFEVEEYGPISPKDWLVCDNHQVALRLRSLHLHEGCKVRKLREGRKPPFYKRLTARGREWIGR